MARRRQYLIWLWALGSAVALTLIAAVEASHFPTTLRRKGSRAPYTLRAPRDLALSMHHLRREKIKEALERYVPIYDLDPQLLWKRKDEIVDAIGRLPPSTWRWPEEEEPEELEGEFLLEALQARERARAAEVRQLAAALFPLVDSLFREGVVADDEFPAREREIRIYSEGRYRRVPVASLHRFSELRPYLRKAGERFFFKTDERVRNQVIVQVLDRLPPNLRYAKENAKHVAHISQVTGVRVELIRRGAVLARRGQVIDSRVVYALRAAGDTQSWPYLQNRLLATLGLALAASLILVFAGTELARPRFTAREAGLLFSLLVVTAVLNRALLLMTPIDSVGLPLAVTPIVAGVLIGRAAAVASALAVTTVAVAGGLLDSTTVVVFLGAGLSGAFVTQPRRRGSALWAGAVAGIAATAVFAACVALQAWERSLSAIWAATQALGGGLAASLLALVVLPLGERLVGRTSQGRLRALCDYEHRLLREFRRRAPATFAHSVALASVAEAVAEAVGVCPLLCRAGGLYHDVGKLEHPERYPQNGRRPVGPDTHVAVGQRLCRRYRLPDDVTALVRQHHGPDAEQGGAPTSVAAVVLLVTEAALEAPRRPGEPARERVARVTREAFAAGRLAEAAVTQAELWRIEEACAAALREEVPEEAERLQEEFVAVARDPVQSEPDETTSSTEPSEAEAGTAPAEGAEAGTAAAEGAEAGTAAAQGAEDLGAPLEDEAEVEV